jgi:opacity protein-like surface antigen
VSIRGLVLVVLCAHGGPAAAEETTWPILDAMLAPAPEVQDWSGPYVGLSYGGTSADITFRTDGAFDLDDGNMRGLLAGYLWQREAVVLGGELALNAVSGTVAPGHGCCEIDQSVDLKARVGYAADRALVYVVLGHSRLRYLDPSGRAFDLDGFAYGIGAEYAATRHLALGLEYLARDGSGTATDDPSATARAEFDTVSLRIAYAF